MDNVIRSFLDLPAEALPAADWLYVEDGDMGDAWRYLRDALRPVEKQRLNHMRLPVRLAADRDGWRDGIIVHV